MNPRSVLADPIRPVCAQNERLRPPAPGGLSAPCPLHAAVARSPFRDRTSHLYALPHIQVTVPDFSRVWGMCPLSDALEMVTG